MELPSLIPQPLNIKRTNGEFRLSPAGRMAALTDAAEPVAELAADYLRPATGFKLPVVRVDQPRSGDISFSEQQLVKKDNAGFVDESYVIEVNEHNFSLSGSNASALARATQTLRQMFPVEIFSESPVAGMEWKVTGLSLRDRPRFRWRGAMLDSARHFLSVENVCRMLDLFALHRLNVFHWHLTDDQGWRVEIKRHPRLTEIGAHRACTLIGYNNDRPRRFDDVAHCGFYSQDGLRHVVDYAARRHITVLPEIDMPGHMQAAVAAYPELGNFPEFRHRVWTIWGISPHILNPSPTTITFMQEVLDEVLEIFPSRFIHLGGDEARKDEWCESRYAQQRMLELGLKNEAELQSYFLARMAEFLTSRGRSLIAWDEIMEGGLAEGAAVMSWRGMEHGIAAAKAGHEVIMTPSSRVYLNRYQAGPAGEPLANLSDGNILSQEQVYNFDPIPGELQEHEEKLVLGSQAHFWSEYIPNLERLEYQAFPRLCALSEGLWSSRENRSFASYRDRLQQHRLRLLQLNVKRHSF